MALDLNGYQLTNNGGIAFASTTARVNAAGLLKTDAIPAMFGSQTNYGGQHPQYPWQVNDVSVNVNTAWTSSTTWTCPVAGIYCINLALICAGSNTGYIGVIVNGALTYYTYYGSSDVWETVNYQVLYKCAVNDTISWSINTSPGPSSGNGTGAYGSNHNMASIWFVG